MTGRLVLSNDPAEFRERVRPFLLEREAENNLLFGILHGIERGRYADFFLGALERNGGVAAVAIRTPPHNLVLSFAPAEAARALAQVLDLDLPGVNAPAHEAAAFAETWAARTGHPATLETSLRIYALTAVRPPESVTGAPRAAGQEDADLLVRWMGEFDEEALRPDDPNRGRTAERVEWGLNDPDSGFLIWDDDGGPVSFAGHSGPTPSGMRIGPVYTPPACRRRGYAAACVAELSARMLAGGKRFCFLYTDLGNPTSNSVYRRIGYEPVCDAAVYRFSQPSRPV